MEAIKTDVKIKLCGMFREEDIYYANEAKPDYIGFILNYPSSKRNILPKIAKEFTRQLSYDIKAVGVFVNAQIEYILSAADEIDLDLIQLHGNENREFITELKKHTKLPVIKAVKVTENTDFSEDLGADFLLYDSGTGTGVRFDHSLIAREKIKKPFFLAGGLTPENLAEAAKNAAPFAVDLSSGIETNGVKDREKMLAAVKAARSIL